ncbi:unnamed protein product [Brugia timori]|uniref:Uncharacterized protein n=1 Tax=Brugia timori TaxID=42155 RepID=A0A3P7YAU4_9BILA|nr:unnamed protein product [Brugia timori]
MMYLEKVKFLLTFRWDRKFLMILFQILISLRNSSIEQVELKDR